jgi:hypothetical protein
LLYKVLVGSERFDLFGDFADHFDEFGGFSRRNPGKVEAIRLDAHMFQQVFHQRELATRVVITFQVMAFAGMSAGHPYGVGPLPQCCQGELGAHATGARNAHHTDVGWILHAADPGQVGGTVAAPVAQEATIFGSQSDMNVLLVLALDAKLLTCFVDRKNLSKNLIVVESMQVNSPGAA